MNKISEKLVISIVSDSKIMLPQLLTLISNSKFRRDGENVVVDIVGTVKFNFESEELKLIFKGAKN